MMSISICVNRVLDVLEGDILPLHGCKIWH